MTRLADEANMLRLTWTIGGTTYQFTYPVSRAWAVKYIRESGEEISK